jgi:hypothetical protein
MAKLLTSVVEKIKPYLYAVSNHIVYRTVDESARGWARANKNNTIRGFIEQLTRDSMRNCVNTIGGARYGLYGSGLA